MSESTKLILSIVLLCVSFALLIVVLIVNKKINNYRDNANETLIESSVKLLGNIELKDDSLFPYFEEHASGAYFKLKAINEIDTISKTQLKKNYRFATDRVIYIINNNLHYPLEKVTIDNQTYFKVDKKIKTVEIFVSFDKPCHYLFVYEVRRKENNEGFELILKEIQEGKKEESNDNKKEDK